MNEYTEAPDGAYWQGYRDALRDAVEAVRRCPCPQGYATHECSCWSDAVAAIETLGGER